MLIFTCDSSVEAACTIASESDLGRDRIVACLDRYEVVAVVAPDEAAADEAFERFAWDFTPVTAAGGVAVDAGRWLMIYRNGRWDLPKGHHEPGETIQTCAVREVLEETGVATSVVRPLCETLHAYYFPPTGRWELKRTHWFELRPLFSGLEPAPQTEEGITRVQWIGAGELTACLHSTFPTIRAVFRALDRQG